MSAKAADSTVTKTVFGTETELSFSLHIFLRTISLGNFKNPFFFKKKVLYLRTFLVKCREGHYSFADN